MDAKRRIHVSKYLSLVLRHQPEVAGVTLDASGWVTVDALLSGMAAHGVPVTVDELREVVATSDKQRFAFSDDGHRIRANQGHSVPVDLGLAPETPPDLLYHGTPKRAVASILRGGIHRGKRQHVHLSADRDTAAAVGQRRGRPVVLVVHAGAMARDGMCFYHSANGVWLTEFVPAAYVACEDDA